MQTSYASRRSRRQKNGHRRGGGLGIAAKIAIALPIFLFLALAAIGVLGFVTVVGAYGYFSQGLADPSRS